MRLINLINGDNSKIIEDFIQFVSDEIGLESIPKLFIINSPISNHESNSFAAYDSAEKKVLLYTKGRHIMDVLRSLAHELVHFKQDSQGVLRADSGKTGSDHENEANAIAGQLMRKYGKLNLELFVK